ncbi:glycoside hydrolase family 25 protein [Amycolatopsis sp. NPDC004378]
MAITFAIDISHHQDKALSLAAARADGCELAILKAGEGNNFVDPDFASNLAEARAAGQLVAAYWYQRSSATAAQHVAKIRQVVPLDVPVIPDVEANSGGVALTRDLVTQLRAAGYRVPLLYLPRWYWQQLGSPSLAGLPPLWSSRYPDNVVGLLADEWTRVPASYWSGYGGLDVALLQFTSSARIAGYAPLDASAFRGTRDQLAALLGGQTTEEDTMAVLTDQQAAALLNQAGSTWAAVFVGGGENPLKRGLVYEVADMQTKLTALADGQAAMAKALASGGVDTGTLASALLPSLQDTVRQALANVDGLDEQAVADRLAADLVNRLAQ